MTDIRATHDEAQVNLATLNRVNAGYLKKAEDGRMSTKELAELARAVTHVTQEVRQFAKDVKSAVKVMTQEEMENVVVEAYAARPREHLVRLVAKLQAVLSQEKPGAMK